MKTSDISYAELINQIFYYMQILIFYVLYVKEDYNHIMLNYDKTSGQQTV